ncbi:MAG: tetratricopeptide repeat protein, partial [Bacteroidota bacterium]
RRTDLFLLQMSMMIRITGICLLFVLLFTKLAFSQSADLDSLKQLLKTEIEKESRIEVLISLGSEYRGINRSESRVYYERAIELAKEIESLEREMQASMGLIVILYETSPDSAKQLHDKVFTYAKAQADTSKILTLLNYRGIFAHRENDWDLAQSSYKQAIQIAESLGESRPGLYINLGMTLSNAGNFLEAIDYYYEALAIFEKEQNQYGLGIIYNNLGVAYYDRKDYKMALEYYDKSYKALSETNNKIYALTTKSSIANVYEELKEYDKVLEIMDEVLQLSEEAGDHASIIEAKTNIARFSANKEIGNFELAKQLIREVTPFQDEMSEITFRHFLYAKALIYESDGQYNLAIYQLQKIRSQSFAKSLEYVGVEDLEKIAKLYAKVGNHKAAYEAYSQFKLLSDSLLSASQLAEMKLKEAELLYNQEKELKEEAYQAEQAIAKQNIRFRNILAGGLVFALLLTMGWGYSVYNAGRQRKQYASQLEKEVDQRTEEIQKANRRMEQYNYELKTFSFIASHDIKEPIRGIGAHSGLIYKKLPESLQNQLGESFQTIKNSTSHLYKLVEDFTRYTAMSHDEEVKIEEVDINSIVTTIIQTFGEGLNKYRGRVQMSDLPKIKSSNSLLFTALKNLIENGLKFNQSKVPIVQVSYEKTEANHLIKVKDNGIGIPAEYHTEVFGMFKSLNPQHEYEGSGIGLAIVRLSVQKLDGLVLIDSEEGSGSTFTISLPLEA